MIISEKNSPPLDSGIEQWVRGKDPWHREAFPDDLADAAPNQGEKRASGWYGLDWCGNMVTFVPDGTEIGNGNGSYRTIAAVVITK